MTAPPIRFIDLFSGIGGFRLGLEKANEEGRILRQQNMHRHRTDADECLEHRRETSSGHISQEPNRNFRCVWSCDNNKYANQVYTRQFGKEDHYTADIRGVDPADIPDFDLICAGFPCQAFSVAGQRKGFQDTRGTLFFEICRIVEAKRPSLLLLENVKGLLSHDGGRTFTVILQALDELGYWLEWQVLNSKYHGVPQNRERVFIVGHLRGTGGREIFPIKETDRPTNKAVEAENGETSLTTTAGYGKQNMRGSYLRSMPISTAIDSNYWKGPDRHRQRTMVFRWQNKQQGIVVDDKVPTLRASGGTDIRKKPLIFHENLSRNVSVSEDAAALRAGASHSYQGVIVANTLDQDGYLRRGSRNRDENGKAILTSIPDRRIRRLTPIECERLQGFPDNWTEGISNTQRYKCLGNAVTVNVIEFLGHRIKEALNALS